MEDNSMYKHLLIALFCILLIFVYFVDTYGYADALSGKTICICEDEAEWPPYHYLKRKNGEKTSDITGYGIDVLNEILNKKGIQYKIQFLPWKRCLHDVAKGKNYQMALSGSYSLERDKNFHLVNWYKTTVCYFYSKKYFPDGLQIKSLSDLSQYRLGGLLGYNYKYLGEFEKKMDKGARNYDAMVEKLHRGRCHLAFEQYEIIAGFASIGKNYLEDKNLGYAKLPGVPPTWFNIMISKNYAHSFALKKVVSEGIAEMFWSGKYKAMLEKYGLAVHR
jgi:polar amino acid transport system substrate-binding protein